MATPNQAGPSHTGSRRRGPDERHDPGAPERTPEALGPQEEIVARQLALAFELEAIRLRRYRLRHPLTAAERARLHEPERPQAAVTLRALLARLRQRFTRTPPGDFPQRDVPAGAA